MEEETLLKTEKSMPNILVDLDILECLPEEIEIQWDVSYFIYICTIGVSHSTIFIVEKPVTCNLNVCIMLLESVMHYLLSLHFLGFD